MRGRETDEQGTLRTTNLDHTVLPGGSPATETARNPLIPLILPSHLDPDPSGTEFLPKVQTAYFFSKRVFSVGPITLQDRSFGIQTGCPLTAKEMPTPGGPLKCVVKGRGAR